MTCAGQTQQTSSGRHQVQGLKCRQNKELCWCLVGYRMLLMGTRCAAVVVLVLFSAVSTATRKLWQDLCSITCDKAIFACKSRRATGLLLPRPCHRAHLELLHPVGKVEKRCHLQCRGAQEVLELACTGLGAASKADAGTQGPAASCGLA